MKISRFFPLLLLTLTCIGAAAQTTGLFTYDGGYFVKAGDYWTEYRPADKDGVWATYTQYGEETNYYQVSNSSCSLSIPKTSNNSFYIWKNEDWQPLYTTKQVYGYFDDESREIYTHNQGGYFTRDGGTWREYRPDKKTGIWATYTQYKEDDNYFYMRSSVSEVCVPKDGRNDFYLLNDGEWMKCYTTSAIYVTKTPAATPLQALTRNQATTMCSGTNLTAEWNIRKRKASTPSSISSWEVLLTGKRQSR